MTTGRYSNLPFEVTPELEIFSAHNLARLSSAINANQRFAYYTSAATAALILQNEELWLRLPSVMNDFSETEHGLGLLAQSLRSGEGARVVSALNQAFPGLGDELLNYISGPDPRRIFADTFIACVSEHLTGEDTTGRLSMWRAYGGVSGVALVFNIDAFATDTGSGVYSSAVEYADAESLDVLIGQMADRLEAGVEVVRALGRQMAKEWAFETVQLAALNVKHPAFDEEREWRLFRMPGEPVSPAVTRQVVSLDGVPQPILKFSVPGLAHYIEKIIIGPTEFPLAVSSALAHCLIEKGITDAGSRIVMSGVPLRQQRR
jgi:hypothetical protein